LAKKQFLPLINTDNTDKNSKSVSKSRREALIDQRHQRRSVVIEILSKANRQRPDECPESVYGPSVFGVD
jgi:hypothetical protein